MSNVSLADHYKSVRARMGMAAPRPVVKPVGAIAAAVVVSPVLVKKPKSIWDGRKLSAIEIQHVVAEYFSVSRDNIISQSRSPRHTLPRHVAMYLCRTLTGLSLTQIGVQFNRDHSTVLHSSRIVAQWMDSTGDISEQVRELQFILAGKSPPVYWGA